MNSTSDVPRLAAVEPSEQNDIKPYSKRCLSKPQYADTQAVQAQPLTPAAIDKILSRNAEINNTSAKFSRLSPMFAYNEKGEWDIQAGYEQGMSRWGDLIAIIKTALDKHPELTDFVFELQQHQMPSLYPSQQVLANIQALVNTSNSAEKNITLTLHNKLNPIPVPIPYHITHTEILVGEQVTDKFADFWKTERGEKLLETFHEQNPHSKTLYQVLTDAHTKPVNKSFNLWINDALTNYATKTEDQDLMTNEKTRIFSIIQQYLNAFSDFLSQQEIIQRC